MRLIVNGETLLLPAVTDLPSLLAALDLRGDRVALLVNDDVVPLEARPTHVLRDDDRVEILTFAGGG
ncbi:MAG: sulfur carrier protein ThiS [Lentisphaerae bacterium]|nr:sulfur carrier protein ThiS [Lentisphaerota bacterium]